MKTKERSNLIFFRNCLFWAYIEKINTFTSGAWSVLLIHIWVTPSEVSKGFVNRFFKKLNPGKGHLPWSDFMVHGVK